MFMGPKYSVLYFKENLMQRKNQMNDRLQKDSLAYDLFKRFGTDVGFGRDLSIKNLERDRK